jgi:hypothetical protein
LDHLWTQTLVALEKRREEEEMKHARGLGDLKGRTDSGGISAFRTRIGEETAGKWRLGIYREIEQVD